MNIFRWTPVLLLSFLFGCDLKPELKVWQSTGGSVAVETYQTRRSPCKEFEWHSSCYQFISQETQELTATADEGYKFLGWSGACSGTETCVLTMNKSREVTASFSKTEYDFSEILPTLNNFIAQHQIFKGASIIVVRKDEGVLYEVATGNQTLDTIALIASASKVPAASILMSLIDDDLLQHDQPIEELVPWKKHKPGITVEGMLSNTSGLPGLISESDPKNLYQPHALCFILPELKMCAQYVYELDIGSDLSTPGSVFNYGGAQWQLAGGVAEYVSGKRWSQLVKERLIEPCGLQIFQYGFNFTPIWNGQPYSLLRNNNPYIEAGAISNLSDYGKLLMMHLNGGLCGNHRVLSANSVNEMLIDRGTPAGKDPYARIAGEGNWSFPSGYGMGWWIKLNEDGSPSSIYFDAGAYGSIAWMDKEREYAAFVIMEDYRFPPSTEIEGIVEEFFLSILPVMEKAIDSTL